MAQSSDDAQRFDPCRDFSFRPRPGDPHAAGATITRGVAMNAAFMAAEVGVRVGMPLLLAAARAEFRKLDKPIDEADFRLLASGAGKDQP